MTTTSPAIPVQAMFDAYERQGPEAIFDHLDPEIEWEVREDLPDADTYHGHDGVHRLLARFDEVLDDQWYAPMEFLEVGDRVIVPIRWGGRGKGSGVEFEERLETWAFTVRGGTIVRIKEFASREDALAWAQS